jgi:hypothetical protein
LKRVTLGTNSNRVEGSICGNAYTIAVRMKRLNDMFRMENLLAIYTVSGARFGLLRVGFGDIR